MPNPNFILTKTPVDYPYDFTTELVFDTRPKVYAEYTLTGSIAFTVNAGSNNFAFSSVGLELIADGVNEPTWPENFIETAHSAGWVNTLGAKNYVIIIPFGNEYLYTITQRKGQQINQDTDPPAVSINSVMSPT